MESKSVRKVDIFNILSYLIKKWFVVILAGILFAGAIGGVEFYKYKVQQKNELFANAHKVEPVYGSFVIYINNFDNSDNYYNRIEDVTAIVRGYSALNKLIEKNQLQADYNIMVNCVTAVTVGINQLEISVEGSLIGMNQDTVVDLTEDLCDIVMATFSEQFGKDSILLIDKPHAKAYVLEKSITLDESKDKRITKRSVIKSGFIGGIIGVVIGAVAVVFYVLTSTILRTRNEVIECFGMTLLGSVDKEGNDKEEYKRVIKRIRDKAVFAAVSVTDSEYRNEAADNLAECAAVNGAKAVVIKITGDKETDKNLLYQYLLGKCNVKDMICDTGRESVKQITWSEASTEEIDLFTNVKFHEAVNEIKSMFDYVFIDCPSMKTSAAGLNIAFVCDGVIVVGSCGIVRENDVNKLKYNFKENNIECLGLLYID